jgi:integral membrane sensor domain MASE1/anti-sigma regulatory factor (Ser/Thr protein kinase)/serine/threonine protein phosphatase PrpC
VWIILVAAVYFASAKLGLTLAFATPNVTAVWPPAGIALAALVLGGGRLWPGVALGAFAANATTDVPVYTAAGIAVGNTLEAFAGAWLLKRTRFRPGLPQLRDLAALTLLAAVLSSMIAATVGVVSLEVGDSLDGGVVDTWRVWWLGDMTGILLVGSLLLVLVSLWPYRGLPGRGFEAVALLVAIVGVGLLVFNHEAPTAYLAFPLVAWAAIRFLQPGATIAALVLATIAVAFTANDSGPFVRSSQDDSLLVAQGFSAVTGLTALMLAVVTSERRRAEGRVRRLAHGLQAGLVPPRLPDVSHFEVAGWYRAGALEQEVGGDFYDVFQTKPGLWMAVIGDACGKGPEAASLTALARYTLRAVAHQVDQPSEALRILNDAILEQRADQRFMTVALAQIAASDSEHAVTLSSGGHHPALVLRAEGYVEQVGPPGTLLGVYADPQLADVRLELLPGDALVLFTDGLNERRHPTQNRAAHIRQLLRRGTGRSAEELVGQLAALALSDGDRAEDDVAVLVLRRRADDPSPARHADPPEVRLAIDLAPEDGAPAAARAALAPLQGEVDRRTHADLCLLVSELVTNCVRHAQLSAEDRIRLVVSLTAETIRVEVTDPGVGFEVVKPIRRGRGDLTGGLGLYLTDQLAENWAVDRLDRGSRVWLELARERSGA